MLRTRAKTCAIRYRGGHPAQKPCGMHRCVQPLEHGQHRAQQIQDVTKPRFSVGVCNRFANGVLTHRAFRLAETLPRLQAVWSTFINTAQLDSMARFRNTGSVCSFCRGGCKVCRGRCRNCRGVLTIVHRRHGSVNSRAAGVATGPSPSTSGGRTISRPIFPSRSMAASPARGALFVTPLPAAPIHGAAHLQRTPREQPSPLPAVAPGSCPMSLASGWRCE